MFIQLLTSPALQSDPSAPVISYPTPGQVLEYAEDDGGSVATVITIGSPAPEYAITGADGALFTMLGNELAWASPPDFESPQDADGDNVYELTLTATNSEDSFAVSFAVQVLDAVDVVPTITFPTAEVVQVPSGRAVAFNGRSSDDASARTWWIVGGADAALFKVVASTGRFSFLAAPDFADPQDADTDNDYELTIQVSTSAGSDTQDVTVRVVEGGVREPVLKPPVISSIKSTWGGIG